MREERWIVVRNWDRFQHPDVSRSDSPPIWIRNYTRLLHKEEYASLTASDRGALHLCWLRYAAADGQLSANSLTVRGQLSVSPRQLDLLNQAGFITFTASKPPKLSASLEKKKEEKKNPPTPLRGKSPNGPAPIPSSPFPGINPDTGCTHGACTSMKRCLYE